MKNIVLILTLIATFYFKSQGQYLQAFVQQDGTIITQPILVDGQIEKNGADLPQLTGFPKHILANSTFKNFRNLTLADLDGDGTDEIIVGVNQTMYVFSAQGLVWEKPIIGVAIYPPSVADMDGDGRLEIAWNTGGTLPGRLYLTDDKGIDLPNFPLNFDNHWMLSAPTLADLDGDGKMEIIVCERVSPAGKIHALRMDGTSFHPNFPISLDRTPAVTPSVGDVDGDGALEIIVFSTQSQYVLNLDGTLQTGFPKQVEGLRYSYQSPILRDLDRNIGLEIVAAGHGDFPEYFARNGRGEYLEEWKKPVVENSWTYSTPTIIDYEDEPLILMSRPNGGEADEMLYAWRADGSLLDGFPIVKTGGLEGIIAVADVDDDKAPELIFGSNIFEVATGKGFIHAYELDGTGEVPNFPLRPNGWTYMNGVCIGDVNGDQLMDLVVLSYTQNFGAAPDSAYVNVYPLSAAFNPDRVWWHTYKGNNTRDGNTASPLINQVLHPEQKVAFRVFPNPTLGSIYVQLHDFQDVEQADYIVLTCTNILGQVVQQKNIPSSWNKEYHLELENLPKGVYFVSLHTKRQNLGVAKIVVKEPK
ncbi:MAG: T9SS type A sorting domain-containing protein [Saprospiraceae bacterium]|nr:T9SS type A sorting domain-containing protein [Saprospiraceae bacterium]